MYENCRQTLLEMITYTYGNADWKDQLTAINVTADGVTTTKTITYDAIGNPLNDGTWTYTWEHGRQLKQMTNGSVTATFVYNKDGLRCRKTVNGVATYIALHGTQVVHQSSSDGHHFHFFYDAQGKVSEIRYNGAAYGVIHNLQGDVIGLFNSAGTEVVRYVYDSWGKVLSTTGSMASTLGTIQPFRYRGYVYDEETELYYLRSRHYHSEIGRFLNSDSIVADNTFSYCSNNPVHHVDTNGKEYVNCLDDMYHGIFLYPEFPKYSTMKP